MLKIFLALIAALVLTSQANAVSDFVDDINQSIELRRLPNSCEAFSNVKGYGLLGHAIASEFQNTKKYSELIKGSQDLAEFCPRYSLMKTEDRFNVWIMVLLNMAYYESSCNMKSSARGPNGPLTGLFQLHLGQEAKYSGGCRNGDGQSAAGSVRCALGMLNDQLRRDQSLFSQKSYWEVLRPQGHADKAYLIKAVILGYDPCRNVR